mgnify:FL=1
MNDSSHNHLIVIAGPTASGKTSLAIKLALYLKCEIVSADSRQFYREISIGTAKPSENELGQVKHHFINNKNLEELYSAGEFEKDVISLLPSLFEHQKIVIMTGGSGMYIDAVCNGFDELPRSISIREELNKAYRDKGISYLQKELKLKDPNHFINVDQKNPQRLIRALEICRITNQPYSSLLNRKNKPRDFEIHKIALEIDKEILQDRIEKRVDEMIHKGLEKEVRNVFNKKHLNSLNTVGYKELFEYIENKSSLTESIEKIKLNTKKYAKRQVTWFKRDSRYFWINSIDQKERMNDVVSYLKTRNLK